MINITSKKLYFISPHLDDAALSAGGLISSLSGKADMTLVNVFTKPSGAKPSFSVRRMLKKCGAPDSNTLFKARHLEDTNAFKGIKIKKVDLEFTDALWRQKPSKWSHLVAELGYVYPIFSLSAKSKKISRHDLKLLSEIKKQLINIVSDPKKSIVFCPLGLGGHVDHIIVNKIVKEIFPNTIFWADYPYSLSDIPTQKPIFTVTKNMSQKRKMIACYKSQINLLFGSKKPVNLSETYYEK